MSTAAAMEWCVLVKGVRARLVKGRCRWYVLQRECDARAKMSKKRKRRGEGKRGGRRGGVDGGLNVQVDFINQRKYRWNCGSD